MTSASILSKASRVRSIVRQGDRSPAIFLFSDLFVHCRDMQVCAPGYQDRKRGKVGRTRVPLCSRSIPISSSARVGDKTTAIPATNCAEFFSNAAPSGLPTACILIRRDGWYDNAAPRLAAGLGMIVRSRASLLLDPEVERLPLARTPDQVRVHPESGMAHAFRLSVRSPDPDRTPGVSGHRQASSSGSLSLRWKAARWYDRRRVCAHASFPGAFRPRWPGDVPASRLVRDRADRRRQQTGVRPMGLSHLHSHLLD